MWRLLIRNNVKNVKIYRGFHQTPFVFCITLLMNLRYFRNSLILRIIANFVCVLGDSKTPKIFSKLNYLYDFDFLLFAKVFCEKSREENRKAPLYRISIHYEKNCINYSKLMQTLNKIICLRLTVAS